MTNHAWHDQWSNVDRTDPQWFIHFLDASRKRLLEFLRTHAAQYYAGIRPGMSVLDVGCGTGVMLHSLAGLVGPGGKVVGVDYSSAMVEEARKRSSGLGLALEFRQGDAHHLDFPNDTFDWSMAALLFQHLPAPLPPLREMVRVTKSGGTVLIAEQDWDTFLIDASDRDVTRRITRHFCDMLPNGWIGRQLPAAMHDAGLANIQVNTMQLNLSAEEWSDPAMGFRDIAAQAQKAGAITHAEQIRWEAEIEQRLREGRFFASFTLFRVSATKP
jgi:ubiquinone/menaquinone biosynthesis C-methylase UbiE